MLICGLPTLEYLPMTVVVTIPTVIKTVKTVTAPV